MNEADDGLGNKTIKSAKFGGENAIPSRSSELMVSRLISRLRSCKAQDRGQAECGARTVRAEEVRSAIYHPSQMAVEQVVHGKVNYPALSTRPRLAVIEPQRSRWR